MSIRYDENHQAKAVRLVREHRDDYHSEWAALQAISGRLGMSAEALCKWVRQTEVDAGEASGGARNSLPSKPNRQASAGLIHL
jgi:transposase